MIHRLVTFLYIESVCDRKHVRRRTVLTGETPRNDEEAVRKIFIVFDVTNTIAVVVKAAF